MSTPSTLSTTAGTDAAVTKIGTEVFGVRVVSGHIRHAEPGSVVLRQLYPGAPADIGVIDAIADGTGRTTIHPTHRREWSDRDRAALAAFFAACYSDRYIAFLRTASTGDAASADHPEPIDSEPVDDRAA